MARHDSRPDRAGRRSGGSRARRPGSSDLADLQALLYRLITAREDGPPAPEAQAQALERAIRGDDRLGADDRIGIYRTAYAYRLLGILKEEYPGTMAIMGEQRFSDLAFDYIAAHPPTEPSVFYAGRFLSGFLAEAGSDIEPYVAELAALERTLIEVFHAEDAPALTEQALLKIPPERWPAMRLRTHPALAMLDLRWRVGEVLRAMHEDRAPAPPPPGPATIVVWRNDCTVYFREIDSAERAGLSLARRGAGFEAICEAVAAGGDGSAPVSAINAMLARWLGDGLLRAI